MVVIVWAPVMSMPYVPDLAPIDASFFVAHAETYTSDMSTVTVVPKARMESNDAPVGVYLARSRVRDAGSPSGVGAAALSRSALRAWKSVVGS